MCITEVQTFLTYDDWYDTAYRKVWFLKVVCREESDSRIL